MRERLIELLEKHVLLKYFLGRMQAEKIADYLIENSVIAPPCKVGDIVYSQKGCFFILYEKDIDPKEVIPCEVIAIKETKKGKFLLLKPLIEETSANDWWFSFVALGKKVFLTREKAEQKLKGGEE